MMATNKISGQFHHELYQWRSEWRMASLDSMCLAAQAMLRFCRIRFETIHCDNPSLSPSGALPMLRARGELLVGYDSIAQEARACAQPEALSHSDPVDSEPFLALLQHVLHPAQLYVLWCERETYWANTASVYSAGHAWPLQHVLPGKMRRDVCAALDARAATAGPRPPRPCDWHRLAARACMALSVRLGDDPFFGGDRPGELDALAYGVLQHILRWPVRDVWLLQAVRQHERLTSFCDRVHAAFFSPSPSLNSPSPPLNSPSPPLNSPSLPLNSPEPAQEIAR